MAVSDQVKSDREKGKIEKKNVWLSRYQKIEVCRERKRNKRTRDVREKKNKYEIE